MTTSTIKNNPKILLQTARTHVFTADGSNLLPVRVLMDGGSQRSYITNSLKTRLGLSPLRTETLNLNTFGEEQFKRRQCELVKVNLQGHDGTDIQICALNSPMICSPPSAIVNLNNYPYLQKLELSEFSQQEGVDYIDILIGSDHYWDVVTGDIAREDGLVAINSKFGWLLSGPVKHGGGSTHFASTDLAIEGLTPATPTTPGTSSEELHDNLHRFWDIESIGILERLDTDEDFKFFQHISFDQKQSRYVVTLPWKSVQPPCDQIDNFNVCKTRLYYLRARLRRNKNFSWSMKVYLNSNSSQAL